ncbi:MAG: Rpn family recombination-promoting nuclease/putative transposase [Candidatus Omnitrophota bacterium]
MVDEQKHVNAPLIQEGEEPVPENQEEQKFKIYLSHDGLFKFAFDNQRIAESFARERLPKEVSKYLDFSTMKIDKDSFVDQKLSRCYSDVLYHVQFKDNPAYLYFLFEHKSWEPNFPGIQLLKNMTHIWESHLSKYKRVKKLPPIIPLLVYHGEYPWNVDTNFLSMFEIPEELKKYIPVFDYELSDVSHMPEEEIKGELELRIVLLALRYIFQPEIMSRLKDIFQLLRELQDKAEFNKYFELLLIYLCTNIKDVKPEKIREVVDQVLEEGETMSKTVLQQLREEGIEIGIKEGIKEGEEVAKMKIVFNCLLKGMDVQTISEITGLSVAQIEILKNLSPGEKRP